MSSITHLLDDLDLPVLAIAPRAPVWEAVRVSLLSGGRVEGRDGGLACAGSVYLLDHGKRERRSGCRSRMRLSIVHASREQVTDSVSRAPTAVPEQW